MGLTLAYGTSSTGFNVMIAGAVGLVKEETRKFQGRPGPYTDRPIRMRARTSPVGRDPAPPEKYRLFTFGIKARYMVRTLKRR